MDTKLKSSRSIRTFLAVVVILAAALCSIYAFPRIGKNAKQYFREPEIEEAGINSSFMEELERGCQVLYYENIGYSYLGKYDAMIREILGFWSDSFSPTRDRIDYFIKAGETEKKNTVRNLGAVLEGKEAKEDILELQETYRCYIALQYDENGTLSVKDVWNRDGREDEIVKALLNAVWKNDIAGGLEEYNVSVEKTELQASGYGPRNFQVVYGIPEDVDISAHYMIYDDYYNKMHGFAIGGDEILYYGTLAVLFLVMLLLTSNRIWRGSISYDRRGSWYLMEAACLVIVLVLIASDGFVEINMHYVDILEYQSFVDVVKSGNMEGILTLAEMAGAVAALYAGWYLGLLFLRPVFSLGVRAYVRQYSLICRIITKVSDWCRRKWGRMKDEVDHIDFSDKTVKTIRSIVILNFLVLAVLSCFWFFGIFALIIYSVIVFLLIKKQYDKVGQDYRLLMQATEHIAQGDLDYEDESDWGVFEPFKEELARIRSGFGKAVENEVKSQRMKAELITNVSHDLKTPLTAITTYVELLKDPAITEEQREAYIQVLEKKSLRLKLLVEDLFEVSKATSNTIRLELMEVDVVNLLKQIMVEHEDKFTEKGLEVRFRAPEEKVLRQLDNQKTYRIFENLFGNIEKYAMPGSRVFVEVARCGTQEDGKDNQVEILIKNMSAQELSFDCTEITERFVRGDAARSTEGSGLGLAIAKSFTEAQKGTFEVSVDGDLFKVKVVL